MMDALERSLAELRVDLSPSSADKARLRARIVAPALGSGAQPLSPPLARWAALQAAGTLGLAAGTLLLGVGMGAGFWLGRETNEPPASLPAVLEPVRALRQTPEVIEATPPRLAPEPPPVASNAAPIEPKRSQTPRPRTTRKSVAPDPLNDELAVLRRVERALRSADPALALALLGELDERFPESRLVEERQAARLMADCRLDNPDATAHARTFLRDYPASVYRQRVQLACEIGAAPAANAPDAPSVKEAVGPGH